MRLACTGLFSWFEKSAVIVTPSRLLASVASQQFTRYQLQRGVQSWQRPSVYSVDAWLTACWQQARYSGSDVAALLSPAQERLLWQEIIEREEPNLFDVRSTARLAIAASRLLAEWQISAGGDLWTDHEDAHHFERWYERFRQQCRENGWVARSDLWRLLPGWIDAGVFERQLTVFAACDVWTPVLEQVKKAFGEYAAVEPLSSDLPTAGAAVQHCSNFAHEIEQAARWARVAFEQDPDRSVGILVPDLIAHRSLVERAFHQVFYPSEALRFIRTSRAIDQDSARNSVFHVNAARALDEHPIVTNALLLLELARPRIAISDAGAILRSPYIVGAAMERSERAFADLRLRRLRDLDVSLRDIQASASECPLLRPAFSQLRKHLASGSPQYLDLPAWSEFIRDLLEVMGWPSTDLNPEEIELLERWKNAVSTLASLGMVSMPVSYQSALAFLRSLLSGETAEQGDWSSPIQIIDSSHAAGIQFDCAFLTGLSDETWPPAVHPSSLVPLTVQRTHGVPGSSRQSIYALRERMTASLFGVAPSVVASFSGRLSPLAEKFVQRDAVAIQEWRGKLPIQSYAPVALDEIDDSYAPPFETGEPIRGGTGIVKSQSLCPFRAFAEYRLRSDTPEEACFGFDSRDRGQFLHKALQTVWDLLRTQDRLRSTPREELRESVRDAVLRAVRDDASSPFHQLTTFAERERLENLILEWLDIERSRNQPFTVETVEQERFYDIPGLRLRLRVDRIDRLRDGTVLLIDYKSGKQTATKLEGDRPAEPQLLVYAAAVDEPVSGVFFGQLKPRELRAVGSGRERHFPGRAANVKKDWDNFMAQSTFNVEQIARGFVSGVAVVDPIKGACDYCSQKPFCRVREMSALAGESELESE